jgi:hypothetical protein
VANDGKCNLLKKYFYSLSLKRRRRNNFIFFFFFLTRPERMSTWIKDVKGKHKKKVVTKHLNGVITFTANGRLNNSSSVPPPPPQIKANPTDLTIDKVKEKKEIKDRKEVKDAAAGPKDLTALDEILRVKHKEIIQKQTDTVTVCLSRLEQVKKEIENCKERYQIRKKVELQIELETLQAKITACRNNQSVIDFEEKVRPYYEAYQDNQSFTKLKQNLIPQSQQQQGNKKNDTTDLISQKPEAQITKKYLLQVENVPLPIQTLSDQLCPNPTCSSNGAPLTCYSCELKCLVCGYSARQMDATSSTIGFGEEVEFLVFSYKKINHFNETLNHLQAKESTQVPMEILIKVMEKIYEKRVRSLDDVTYQLVYQTLKDLQLSKYYEQTSQIFSRLTGKPPPRFTLEQEENLRRMFNAIIYIYDRVKPPKRRNFLSYSFVLFKCCQLLGYNDFLSYFNLHRGKEKLEVHEQIWKKICVILNWKFIPCPMNREQQVSVSKKK